MVVKVEAKAEVARTESRMTVATMATTPTVTAEAPIGHATITGMTHARGAMGDVANVMAHPLPIHATAADVDGPVAAMQFLWERLSTANLKEPLRAIATRLSAPWPSNGHHDQDIYPRRSQNMINTDICTDRTQGPIGRRAAWA